MKLTIETPRWALPLYKPCRYKGIKGGRASGKSHERAEALVERMICEPDLRWVCIREIQKSLKFSSKQIIEDKIKKFNVGHLFDITLTEIRRKGAGGVVIFQGMQDHTADSIKSLEGFDGAWVEEAQSLSKRSLELLEPTIRKQGSELWFTWNPDSEDDPVEQLFTNNDEAILIHVNYYDNPYVPEEMIRLAELQKKRDYEGYCHIWLGEYKTRSDAQIFRDKYRIDSFVVDESFGDPLHGLDFGFANDPTAAVRLYIKDNTLYVSNEAGKVGLELDDTADYIKARIPDIEKYTVRADSARPESISYLKRHGLPRITGVQKGKGSVEDGIDFIRSFDEVVIHSSCKEVANEFNKYSYKVDKRTEDILPVPVDAYNHYIDAIRYALEPIMKNKGQSAFTVRRR